MPEKKSDLLKNISEDLKRSILTPLLLEISSRDLDDIAQEIKSNSKNSSSEITSAHSNKAVINLAYKLYTLPIPEGKKESHTNVLQIDCSKYKESEDAVIIYDVLMDQLEEKIKKELNIDVAKDVIKGALLLTFKNFGGDILNLATFGHASYIVSETSDYLVDAVGSIAESISDEATSSITEIINAKDLSDTLSDVLEEVSGMSSDQILDFINDKCSKALYLSPSATDNLKTLYSDFTEVSFAQALRLFLRLLITISIDVPKLIIIKNPHHLDILSLTIISKYFALAKDNESKLSLSFMYIYDDTNAIPGTSYSTEQKKEIPETIQQAKRFLDDQRLFMQRYGMLKQPKSDLPIIAIPSDLFVGRESERKELLERTLTFKTDTQKIFDSKEHRYINTINVIQAEPGIGKTALYHQHMRELFDTADEDELKKRQLMLQLYIHNDNGISGSGTGLVSFVDSIIQEYQRLETYYIENYKHKIKKYKSKIEEWTLNATNTFIHDSLPDGLKELKDIASSLNKRIFVNGATEGLGNRLIDASSQEKQRDSQEEYFQEILNKLEALKQILSKIDNSIPNAIILFIDDVHWIDESSAKFIITKLLPNNHVRIITTARISDANSRYQLLAKNATNNPYHLTLFEKLQLIEESNCIKDNRESIEETIKSFTCKDIKKYTLDGFDSKLLSQLINEAFKTDSSSSNNIDYLSNAIINFLDSDEHTHSKSAVTLFAVETLNIISDKRFYEDKDITPIITEESGTFTLQNTETFKSDVDAIFSAIKATYEESAGFATGADKDQKSSVMSVGSFAILEERLRLLAMYFGEERGEAIVQHILFSSIMGSPFDTDIISSSFQVVLENDSSLLKPLQNELKDHTLTQEDDFTTLENIYQMILRLIELETRYIYSHSLLEIFLEKKMDHFFARCYQESGVDINEAKSLFYRLLYDNIKKNHLPEVYHSKSQTLSQKESDENLYYENLLMRISRKGFEVNSKNWAEYYTRILNNLASSYYSHNHTNEAIGLLEESLKITKEFYTKNPEQWAEHYTSVLGSLAVFYEAQNKIGKAIKLQEESLHILKKLNQTNPDRWA